MSYQIKPKDGSDSISIAEVNKRLGQDRFVRKTYLTTFAAGFEPKSAREVYEMVAGKSVTDELYDPYSEAWERNWDEAVELWGIVQAALAK